MYKVRLFATKNSRLFEATYFTLYPLSVFVLKYFSKFTANRLDGFVTFIERNLKGFFFDCKMCGNCVLSTTGMSCPMNCPKNIRNGPCGGVRENGNCEVKPEMRCVWVEAWNGSKKMKHGHQINDFHFTVDNRLKGSSSWLRIMREGIDKDEPAV